ncbi:exodeoxyribonuclease III [Wenzhouxiangella marina]|uniref:Exodeoxyribonuclease III n=1 Tax=Wenzhouxiangella marina TaxID=1579979 RepID=A0A0K0XUQ2_9GAMM|nr:exodeoxyribonuclease III [Wenzhouxiangella marina]AKS41346.1 exodeoxyribonuclease III [Wenzhouxiangella marina]MBB6086904.1 exodeoxyribonuclease-3 [Wenzhouxiangella marina]
MKIASWNVNSLKVRLDQVVAWLEHQQPAVLGLQETKLVDEKFPAEAFNEVGYQVIFSGQPTYNGVALIARSELADPVMGIPGFEDDQKRVIAATVDGVRVINLYVVNGQEVGSEKFDYKLRWLDAVTAWVEDELSRHQRLVVMGDFNIAPDDRDVYDPEAWHEKILCSTPEREALGRMLDLGLHDSFRLFDQPEKTWSWWDYRAAMFRRGLGLRIDLVLCSEALKGRCSTSYIDKEPRRNERPSDHAPAVAEFTL